MAEYVNIFDAQFEEAAIGAAVLLLCKCTPTGGKDSIERSQTGGRPNCRSIRNAFAETMSAQDLIWCGHMLIFVLWLVWIRTDWVSSIWNPYSGSILLTSVSRQYTSRNRDMRYRLRLGFHSRRKPCSLTPAVFWRLTSLVFTRLYDHWKGAITSALRRMGMRF